MHNKKINTEILLVGFGNLSALAADFKKAFPDYKVTASKTVTDGLAGIEADADNVMIQPVYLLPAFEYERLCRQGKEYKGSAVISKPLLHSDEKIMELANFLHTKYGDKPTLFAGHGSLKPQGQAVYAKLIRALHQTGFEKSFVGVVEGVPSFDHVVKQIQQRNISSIRLAPLTLICGKHVREDIFGEGESSCQSLLGSKGIETDHVHETLLDYAEVRQMFVDICKFAISEK